MFIDGNLQRRCWAAFSLPALMVLVIGGAAQPNLAADKTAPEFDSPEQAAAALYKAARNHDQGTINQLIGPLASSGDMVQDKGDREQFVRKYSEMHRFVKTSDAAMTLYVGAENWPFPIPLIANHGKWRFDLDAGTQEILFRRIGENETTAIDTCRTIAKSQAAAAVPAPGPSHGYIFKPTRTSAGGGVVTYPSHYGSTGVMTFAATPDGKVYEKDLGRKQSSAHTPWFSTSRTGRGAWPRNSSKALEPAKPNCPTRLSHPGLLARGLPSLGHGLFLVSCRHAVA